MSWEAENPGMPRYLLTEEAFALASFEGCLKCYFCTDISYGFPKESLFEYKEKLAIEPMRSCQGGFGMQWQTSTRNVKLSQLRTRKSLLGLP